MDLPALDEHILKQDGQKSDDAPVPRHVWENHFKDTLPEAYFPTMPQYPGVVFPVRPLHPCWRERLESYRQIGIRYWRRQVLLSFWVYLKSRLRPHMKLAVEGSSTYVWWTGMKYVWAKRGRARYTNHMRVLLDSPVTRKDWGPARECVFKAMEADWWDWLNGSRPFFWRWPTHTISWARDGQPHFQTRPFPKFTKPQQAPRTPQDRTMVWRKL